MSPLRRRHGGLLAAVMWPLCPPGRRHHTRFCNHWNAAANQHQEDT